MKNTIKLISTLLAVIMLLSSMSAMLTITAFADDAASGTGTTGTTETGTEAGTGDETGTAAETAGKDAEEQAEEYLSTIHGTPEGKLATMTLLYTEGDFEIYVDSFSGEVACKNVKTNEIIFTNPYDVGSSTGVDDTKYELLSQIMVEFTDNQGQTKVFNSFEQAAMRKQINVEKIKGGVRVEYTIGREQAKTLVPRLISQERFEKMILQPLIDYFGEEALFESGTKNKEIHNIQKYLTYYTFYAKGTVDMSQEKKDSFGYFNENLQKSDRELARVLNEFPIVDRMNVFVFDPKASATEIEKAEQLIMTYCPEYTYEELDYDHALTEYESDDENPPVFRMALEYKIDTATGLIVRLPANGIRFNESLYTLSNITVLPYMGAGNSAYEGYNFFPDGSGALFDFQDLHKTNSSTVVGKVYGTDFAYHEISGTYQKTIRYPVFGIKEDTKYYEFYESDTTAEDGIGEYIGTISGAIYDTVIAFAEGGSTGVCKGSEQTLTDNFGSYILDKTGKYVVKEVERKRGFVAIIEEGDALASLSTYHAGSIHDYNTIMMAFTPRPKDTYNLKDSISVADNSEWTVVSDRKYVGGYTVRYIMLSDPEKAPEGTDVYDASWLGMAKAYRDYLTVNNVIAPLTSEDVTNDIPLYVETFGTIETTEKIMSIPVTVMAPLTTFEDVLTMYNQLKADGIKNINFKLTGYTNGGMEYTVPTKLKFEKAVGGNKGFQELLNKANEINKDADPDTNLGIYPDFNIVFALDDDLFDGFSWREHCGKTIDDRYAARKGYSATQQKYENFYETVISPAYFYVLYEKITKNYAEKYENIQGISVSTLGSWLNSDFDEDEPYNREDSKQFTKDAFEYLGGKYNQVMTDGGNAYVWQYVDHMLNVSLDSSRYSTSSNAVPFIGVVLHGSVSFAGEPLNMEGDLKYAILKAIENGASPYFILSMQNTQALKDTDFSKYYSIRYDIWSKDIADVYNKLNEVLGDVQDKYIIGHEFLENGSRVPDADELREDILNIYDQILNNNINASEILDKQQSLAVSAAREFLRNTLSQLEGGKTSYVNQYNMVLKNIAENVKFGTEYYANAFEASKAYYIAGIAAGNDLTNADFKIASEVRSAVKDYNSDAAKIKAIAEKIYGEDGLLEAFNDAKVAALTAFLKDEFAKQQGRWVDQIYNSKDDEAILKDVLADYIANQMSANSVPEETKPALEAMLAEVKAKLEEGKDMEEADLKALLKTYLGGRTEMFTDAMVDEIVAKLVNAGTMDSDIQACFDRNAPYTYNSDIVSAMKEVFNSDDSGRNKHTALYKAYNDAYVNAANLNEELDEAARNEWDTKKALDAFEAIYGDLIAAYNALEAGKQALELAKTMAAEYDTIYGVLLDRENNLVFRGVVQDGAKHVAPEADAGNTAYKAAVAAYDAALASLENVATAGYVDKYIFAIAELAAIKDKDVAYAVDTDNLQYLQKAVSNAADARANAISESADIKNRNYHEVRIAYTKAIELLVDVESALETIKNAESGRKGGLASSKVWAEAEEFYNSIKAVVAEYEAIYNEIIGGEDNVADAKLEEIKTLIAATKFDNSFDADLAEKIESLYYEEEEEQKPEDEIIIEDNSKYNTENIVAVTYGTKDGQAYKTVILNYNNYTVRVVFNGLEYTIPPYEYAEIVYN